MAQKLKEDVRERIEVAAIDTLIEKGIEDCDMRSIAKRANVTPGNLYRYFKNKDDLINLLLSPMIKALDNIIKEQTDGYVSLNSSDIFMPKASEGQDPTEYFNNIIQQPLENAIIKLGSLGRKEKKLMQILINNKFMADKMYDWLMGVIKNALKICFVTSEFDKVQTNIMIKVFTISFCEGVAQLLKSNNDVTEEDYIFMAKAYVYMQMNGLIALINQQIQLGNLKPNSEVFKNAN